MFEIDLQKHRITDIVENTFLCNIRKRLINITPEEEVRQAVINFLVLEKGYPLQNIFIEIPMSHFQKGAKGRADILIKDYDNNVICLIECKKPNEFFTDNVIDQLLKYQEIVDAESSCIIIGNCFYFFAFVDDETEPQLLDDFPSFETLMGNGQVNYALPEEILFVKYNYKEPLEEDIIEIFYDEGVFGKDTDRKYLPFLFNLYNFYIDEEDKLTSLNGTEDIGLKLTKYGNAGGGQVYGYYRAFIHKKSIVSFSISSNTKGEGSPINTSLLVAVDVKGYFHLSLELKVEKYVIISENFIDIIHDGTITIGKLGAAKRSELIDFIKSNAPHLLDEDKIILGQFNKGIEIKAEQEATQNFIKNCIDYALIRDEFRKYKKGIC